MGSIISVFTNIVAIVVAILTIPTLVVIALVQTAFGGSFEQHMSDALEFIFGLFGLTGADIINTNVTDNRMLGDDYTSLMTQVALIHQDTQMGIIDIMKQHTMGIMGRYNTFFDYGKNHYVDGLPTSNMTNAIFPTAAVIAHINSTYGVTCELSYKATHTPTKEEYMYHHLYDLYGFSATTNKLTYLTYEYTLDYIDYNYGTNYYDAHIYREESTTTDVTTEVTITITNIDATHDNRHTVTNVTTTVTSNITGVSSSTVTTTTDVVIPIGTETNSYSINTVYGTPVLSQYSPTVVSVIAFGPYAYHIAIWNVIGLTEPHYWTYKIGSGVTALDERQVVSNLDMLPIVEIRHDLVNINSNPTNPKYLQSKEMLSMIGLNIDDVVTAVNGNPAIADITDAFVYFGLDISDTSPVVSKMIYKTFEFIFETASSNPPVGVLGTVNQYRITVREGNYNSALAWSNQTLNYIAGSIGPVGTYQNQVVGADLILRHQSTPSQYTEYHIYELFTVAVLARGGLYAAVTKTFLAGPVILPLSYNLVNQFSPIEQMELFCKSLRLSVYSATVTHLAYYETADFALAVQIIMITVTIVLSVLSGGSYLAIAGKILVGLATSYAIKKILESTLPGWLKILLIIATIALGAYGTSSIDAGEFLSAEQVTQAVSDYATTLTTSATTISPDTVFAGMNMVSKIANYRTNGLMEDLQDSAEAFGKTLDLKVKEISDKMESVQNYVSTEFVTGLANMDMTRGYVEGYDMNMYKAVGMQYDHVYLSVSSVYENIYDYDRKFQIGIISMDV